MLLNEKAHSVKKVIDVGINTAFFKWIIKRFVTLENFVTHNKLRF
jgi:hypothetical protein